MPQLIKDTDFKLTNTKYNQELTTKLINSPHTVLEDTLDYKLIVAGNENSGHIALLNKEDNMLDYMVKYRNNNKRLVGHSVTQVALWRKWDSPWVQGITTRIFFDYLLNNWPTIMSDSQQTEDGKRFWQSRMAQAVREGLRVGLVNLNISEVKWFQGKPNDLPKWLAANNAWNKDPAFAFVKFLISNKY